MGDINLPLSVSLCYEGEQGVVYSLGESADKRRSRWPIKTGSGEEKAEPKRQLQRRVCHNRTKGKIESQTTVKECKRETRQQ